MKNNYAKNYRGKRKNRCPILVAEYLAIREVIVMVTLKNLQRFIIESDS